MTRAALGSAQAPALDGLRGLAALMVVASHASGMGMHMLPGLSLVGIGKHGVFLFFVLSAFLLTSQWLPQWQQRAPLLPAASGYFLRRLARIYPLYLAVLLAGWLLPPKGLGVPLDGAALLRHLGLLEGRGIYWSIPVEFQYYLVLPLVAGLLTLSWGAGMLALLIAACAWLLPAHLAPLSSDWLGYYLPVFLFGAFAAWLWCMPTLTWRRRQSTPWGGVVGDLLFTGLLVFTVPALWPVFGWPAGADALHRSFIFWGAAWALAVLALLQGWLPRWSRLLSNRALRACGCWSFGIYLLHLPALHLVRLLPVPEGVKFWLVLALSLVLAAVAFLLIERPAMRWASAVTSPRMQTDARSGS